MIPSGLYGARALPSTVPEVPIIPQHWTATGAGVLFASTFFGFFKIVMMMMMVVVLGSYQNYQVLLLLQPSRHYDRASFPRPMLSAAKCQPTVAAFTVDFVTQWFPVFSVEA